MKRINRREPLLAGVFPKPEQRATPYYFREAYDKAVKVLPNKLLAGDVPSQAEIAEEDQTIKDYLALKAEQEKEGGQAVAAITPGAKTPPAQPQPMVSNPRMVGGPVSMGGPMSMGGGGDRFGGGMGNLNFQAPTGDPKYDPVYRAVVTKAKNIRCYAGPQSFHVSPILQTDAAPSAGEMWTAHVSLLVQQDIVAAIAALNDAAAQQVTGGDACVEQMPVKRIESIRVWGYLTSSAFIPFHAKDEGGGTTGIGPPTGPSFTGKSSDEQFDVVRFTLVAVVDQRSLLQLIDQISRQNFYQCVNIDFSAVTPENTPPVYMFGPAPTIRAVLDFEGYLARAVYKPLMPPEIRKALGIDKDDKGG